MPRSQKVIVSFNGGEVSPLLAARPDLSLASNACRTMTNTLPSVYGMAQRRAGLLFIGQCKATPGIWDQGSWAWSSGWSGSSGDLPGPLTAPVLSPTSSSFVTTLDVSVTALAGVTVRYTTNGEPVTATSDAWPTDSAGALEALTITTSTTIRAKAFFNGYESSEVVGVYAKTGTLPQVATPEFDLFGSTLTITCATSGATISYIKNGGSVLTYSAPFSVIAGDDIEAYATKSGFETSDLGYYYVGGEGEVL